MVSELSKLSFSDLYAMYNFVIGVNNMTGKGKDVMKMVRKKMEEIQEELYLRTFNGNPWSETKSDKEEITIGGQDPFQVISSFSPQVEKVETFVVVKNEEAK